MQLSGFVIFAVTLATATAFSPPSSVTSLRSARLIQPTSANTSPQDVSVPSGVCSSSTQLFSSMVDQKELLNFFLMKLIENGVPAVFTIITILFAAKAFKGQSGKDQASQVTPAVSELYDDLYGSNDKKPASAFLSGFGKSNAPSLPRNSGIPSKQYLTIKNLNEKYESYDYNIVKATQSKAAAAATMRNKNFDRALQLSTFGAKLELHEKAKLMQSEAELLRVGSKVMKSIVAAETKLTDLVIRREISKLGVDVSTLDPAPATNGTDAEEGNSGNAFSNMMKGGGKDKDEQKIKKALENELVSSQKALLDIETRFIQNVTQILGSNKVSAFRAAVLGDISTRGIGQILRQLEDRPLSTMLSNVNGDDRKKSVFVMRFPGDVQASQVKELREETTAVIRSAKSGDEALLVLESGGGTVTGYGLAAGQLMRFKEAGIKLTVCVEQVAASGGYMMCCVADRIVASPMAVLGSIGVISDMPNVYERLQREGIEFQTVTAGKYKRTLTPTKKPTKADFDKTKEDVEQILVLFKKFVHDNRPSLVIDEVATGETWFGMDALERGLCDEIKTADTVLADFVKDNYNVFEIQYSEPSVNQLSQLLGPRESIMQPPKGMIGSAVRWMARTIKDEVEAELSDSGRVPVNERYMLKDESSTRIRLD